MPWGDGTGPAGGGPMTGRGAGYCAGYNVPGYLNPAVPGWGGGLGRGRGNRYRYYATGVPGWARFGTNPYYNYAPINPYYGATGITKEQQLNALKSQADLLKKNLEDIDKAIGNLEKENEGST